MRSSRSSRLALRTSSPTEARSEAFAMTFAVAPEESGCILDREKDDDGCADDDTAREESWGVPPAIALDAFSAAVLRRSEAAVEGGVLVVVAAAAEEEDDSDADSSIAVLRAVRAAPRARAADSDDGSVSSLASDSTMDCMERCVMFGMDSVVGHGEAEISRTQKKCRRDRSHELCIPDKRREESCA